MRGPNYGRLINRTHTNHFNRNGDFINKEAAMALSRDILSFIKECADEKNIRMFKTGAKAGNATLLSVVDDFHEICKLATSSEQGVGIAMLRQFFPKTSKTIEDNQKRIQSLQIELFPQLPQDNITYEANVLRIDKNNEGHLGYMCRLNMKPMWEGFVANEELTSLNDNVPKTAFIKCLERVDDAWLLVKQPGYYTSYTYESSLDS
jgi:hypothetical protein